MKSKFYPFLALLILFSMVLGACSTAAPEVVETEAPVVVEPEPEETEELVVEPTAAPELDVQAFAEAIIASLPADKGFGGVAAAKLNEELVEGNIFLVDVREPSELEADGYIEGAVNIPLRSLMASLDKLPTDRPIVVYCAVGHRGGIAMVALRSVGFADARSLSGGLTNWKKASLELVTGAPAEPEVINPVIAVDPLVFNYWSEYLTNLPENFSVIPSDKLAEALTTDTPPFLLDIRSADEWNKDGYIEGAVNIPLPELLASLDKLPAKDAQIVVYCGIGHRGTIALTVLNALGWTNVQSLKLGMNGWKGANMPVAGWINWPVVFTNYLASLPAGYSTISAADLNTALVENPPFLLDVREEGEITENGYIAGAIHLPIREVFAHLEVLPPLDQPIVVYCASGHRGGAVMAALQMLGYKDVRNLGGGIGAWKKAELPLESGLPVPPSVVTEVQVDETMLRDFNAYFSALPDGFNAVKPVDVNTEIASGTAPMIIDLRTQEELTNNGWIEGSTHIVINDLLADMTLLPTDKAAPIVLVCASGHRGGIAMVILNMLGYTNVRNMGGGMNAWIAAELPVTK